MEGKGSNERRGSFESASALGPNAQSFFYAQRSAAAGAAQGLSGLAREGFIGRNATAKEVAENRKARRKDLEDLTRRDFQARLSAAENADEKKRIELDLAEFEDALRMETVEKDADAHAQSIDNLASEFERGKISAQEFQTSLTALIGGPTGESNGQQFGERWIAAFEKALGGSSALQAILANNFGGTTGAQPVGGPDPEAAPESPQGVNYEEWRKRRGDFIRALQKAKQGKGGFTRQEQTNFRLKWGALTLPEWMSENPEPPRAALGGITRGITIAGEAGPEAIVPLTGSRGVAYMARVMDEVMRSRGGGARVVNVTFEGVIDAREAARRIKPEIDRIVSLT
jgi:NAD(P)-dependent dehydrogenase (short-subunit alcohol dehydrogenase family)